MFLMIHNSCLLLLLQLLLRIEAAKRGKEKERLTWSLLVGETTGGSFETLRGDKTQSFISRTKAYKHKKLTIHALSLSL